MSQIKILFLLLSLTILGSACGGKSPEAIIPNGQSFENKKETELLNRKIATAAFTQSVTDDYRIGPGDLVEVEVYEAQDLSGDARVNSSGMATVPLLGAVELGSLTTREAEERLEQLIGAKYVKDPHVSVFIKEYRSKKVAVVGAVNKPGSYELLGKGTLLDALAEAGGLSDTAGKLVFVTKQGESSQIEIDLEQLLVKGDGQLNLPISMGDTIFVPEAGVYYVNGAVARPGTFTLKDDVTITQAVGIAGGLQTGAKASDVQLIRYQEGQRQIIPIDLEAIESGQRADIALQDQDVVFVDKNAIIAFFQTIRLGLSMFPFHVSGTAPQ